MWPDKTNATSIFLLDFVYVVKKVVNKDTKFVV